MIETLFVSNSTRRSSKSGTKGPNSSLCSQENKVLDPKKSQVQNYLCIFLSRDGSATNSFRTGPSKQSRLRCGIGLSSGELVLETVTVEPRPRWSPPSSQGWPVQARRALCILQVTPVCEDREGNARSRPEKKRKGNRRRGVTVRA
jgi:hypothetical protein